MQLCNIKEAVAEEIRKVIPDIVKSTPEEVNKCTEEIHKAYDEIKSNLKSYAKVVKNVQSKDHALQTIKMTSEATLKDKQH